MNQDKLEAVPQAMINEMERVSNRFTPTVLGNVIEDNFPLINTPTIAKWYNNRFSVTNKLELQLKLIKHIWLHDPQFKAEKPKKWVVRAVDSAGAYYYLDEFCGIKTLRSYAESSAYRFDTKDEALEYATPQCEVVEVEE